MKPDKSYYRVMLGEKSMYAEECFAGNFIGTDFSIKQDLTSDLTDDWRRFNQKFIPIYLSIFPDKTRSAPGWLAAHCGRSQKEFRRATLCCVLMDRGTSARRKNRPVQLRARQDSVPPPSGTVAECRLPRSAMSEALRRSAGSIGTVANATQHGEDIERLMSGAKPPVIA